MTKLHIFEQTIEIDDKTYAVSVTSPMTFFGQPLHCRFVAPPKPRWSYQERVGFVRILDGVTVVSTLTGPTAPYIAQVYVDKCNAEEAAKIPVPRFSVEPYNGDPKVGWVVKDFRVRDAPAYFLYKLRADEYAAWRNRQDA